MVYCLVDTVRSEIFYVGATYRTLRERFNEHCKPSHNTNVYRHIVQVGKDNVNICEIEECDCYDDLYDREYFWTTYYNKFFNLVNLDIGKYHGKTFFQKMSGKNSPRYGKCHTEETKAKIRAWTLAHPNSKESIKKVANALTGKKHSVEWCQHIKEGLNKLYSGGYVNANAKKVILINTGEVFDSSQLAEAKYSRFGAYASHIVACCKGKRKSSGKKDNQKLVWEYYNFD